MVRATRPLIHRLQVRFERWLELFAGRPLSAELTLKRGIPTLTGATLTAEAAGIKATRINVACAFHSPVVAAARDAFGAALDAVDVRPPEIEVWSNARAEPYPADPDGTGRVSIRDLVINSLRMRPDTPATLDSRGTVLLRLGRFDEAIRDFDRALRMDPQNTWALLGQGDVNTWLRRPEEAAHSFEQALEISSTESIMISSLNDFIE